MDPSVKNIRILLLEDVFEDAELILTELKKGGLQFISEVVDDHPGFEKALHYFDPTIILADYRLPSFSGFEALELTLQNSPNIPFVFVTGAVGEEIAAETILSGASGLVLKNNLKKLPQVVSDTINNNDKWKHQRITNINLKVKERINKNIDFMKVLKGFLNNNKFNIPLDILEDMKLITHNLKMIYSSLNDY